MPNSSKTSLGSVPFPFCALDATQRGLWADAPNHADILTNMDLYMGLWGYNVHLPGDVRRCHSDLTLTSQTPPSALCCLG